MAYRLLTDYQHLSDEVFATREEAEEAIRAQRELDARENQTSLSIEIVDEDYVIADTE